MSSAIFVGLVATTGGVRGITKFFADGIQLIVTNQITWTVETLEWIFLECYNTTQWYFTFSSCWLALELSAFAVSSSVNVKNVILRDISCTCCTGMRYGDWWPSVSEALREDLVSSQRWTHHIIIIVVGCRHSRALIERTLELSVVGWL